MSNNCGVDGAGLGLLLGAGRIRRVTASYVGENKEFARQYLAGELEVELTPQGTLAERLRAGGAGIAAFFTPTGVGTQVAEGGLPWRYDADGSDRHGVAAQGGPRVRLTATREFVLEEAIVTDFALVRAAVGDRHGNLVFHASARNFNPLVAMAGRITIAEVEQLVEPGEIDPDEVHLPGVYVQRVVALTPEQAATSGSRSAPSAPPPAPEPGGLTMPLTRDQLAARAARELTDGQYVNLGIGLPTLIPNHLPDGVHVVLQSENGILGVGAYPSEDAVDPDLINAGKETVTVQPGSSFFDSALSFGMIRGGQDRRRGARRDAGHDGRRPRQLDDPRQDGQGHGRRHGPRARRQAVVVLMEHMAKDGSPKLVAVHLPLHRQGRRAPHHHRPRGAGRRRRPFRGGRARGRREPGAAPGGHRCAGGGGLIARS